MMDLEDNLKAVLAEISVTKTRRTYWWGIGWLVLGALILAGSMIEVILTVDKGAWWAPGLVTTAASAVVTGILSARADDRWADYDKARNVDAQWKAEILMQGRIDREHEDGEPA